MGTYKKESNQWQTSYLNIPKGFDPTKFTVKTDPNKGLYKTVGNLNVRYGSFSPAGDFPPPTNTPLLSGHSIQLKSTAEWFDSGNWWATIEPPK